jgi:hypothetical protein
VVREFTVGIPLIPPVVVENVKPVGNGVLKMNEVGEFKHPVVEVVKLDPLKITNGVAPLENAQFVTMLEVLMVIRVVTVLTQQLLDGVTVYTVVVPETSFGIPEIVPVTVLKSRPLLIGGEIANDVGDAAHPRIETDWYAPPLIHE